MHAHPTRIILILTALGGVSVFDSSAEAQLFRRLRDRIESRIGTPPVTPALPARPGAGSAAQQRAGQPKLVRPIAPPPGASENQQPSDGKFGGSILARPEVSQETTSDRPTLGVDVLQAKTEVGGVRVVRIREESQADEAGLKLEDVIIAVDGVRTPTIADVAKQISDMKVGQRILVRVIRGNRALDLSFPLVSKNATAPQAPTSQAPLPTPQAPGQDTGTAAVRKIVGGGKGSSLGLKVEDLAGQRGAVIKQVEEGSPASSAGLKEGDRIVSIGGALVSDSQSFLEQVSIQPDKNLSLRLVREGVLVETELDRFASASKANSGAPTLAKPENEPTALNEIGSVLGGLFGGAAPKKATDADKPPESKKTANSDSKQEPTVKQVDFQSPKAPSAPTSQPEGEPAPLDRKLDDDPPSLDELELPPGKPTPIRSKDDKIKELQEEIERLREQLKSE